MATLQSAAVTFFLEKDLDAWKLHSTLELAACFYSVSISWLLLEMWQMILVELCSVYLNYVR